MPARPLYKPLSRAVLESSARRSKAVVENSTDLPEIDLMKDDLEGFEKHKSEAPEEPGTSLFFADVAFRGDTHRLARLLVDDLETTEKWSKEELGTMLTHQLGTSLDPELSSADWNLTDGGAGRNQGLTRRTFGEVLFGEGTSVRALRLIKEYAKAHLVHKDPFPAEISRVLYYGSVVAARRRCGERISSLSDAKCRIGVDWVLKQEWIAPEILDWFRASRDALSDQ
jgi:hypothetical protein